MILKFEQHKKLLLAAAIFLVVILIVFYLLYGYYHFKKNAAIKNNAKYHIKIFYTPTPEVIHRQQNLNLIYPGVSTKQDIVRVLGQPTRITINDGYTIYYYNLLPTRRENSIYITGNKVAYIDEEIPVNNTLYVDFTKQQNASADGTLNDKSYTDAGFYWYVFSTKGAAFLANPSDGYTIQVLRFMPMNYSAFLNSAGQVFSMKTTYSVNNEKF